LHYTNELIQYAISKKIFMLLYPSHATHVLQGLDVACFSTLKIYWGQVRDAFEEETQSKLGKEHFLEVYTKAHTMAMTPQNIKAAFQKTGIHPWDPLQIHPSQIALSIESSIQGSLPLPQPSPVWAIMAAFQKTQPCNSSDSDSSLDEDRSPAPPHTCATALSPSCPSTSTSTPLALKSVVPIYQGVAIDPALFTPSKGVS
jgi:hypothetical protein